MGDVHLVAPVVAGLLVELLAVRVDCGGDIVVRALERRLTRKSGSALT